jgi:hypothetical protein
MKKKPRRKRGTKHITSLTFSPWLAEALALRAKSLGISRSQLVSQACEDLIRATAG